MINEGGFGGHGAEGASTIADLITEKYTHYCCAVGTGTMMAGLIRATSTGERVIGIPVMKNNHQLEENVRLLLDEDQLNWQIQHDYHFGGYAKHAPELLGFMNELYLKTSVPTDFVYTGKLFYAVRHLACNGYFPLGSRLLIIHSGGLQGNDSLKKGTLIF